MRATSLLVFTCYFVLLSFNEDFPYLLSYLGIIITNNLSWNEHCDKNCKKANSTLGIPRRILSGCAPQVKNTAYCMLVRSKLEYASSVWNSHTKCNVYKIEMVQRRAARFVCHDYSCYSHVHWDGNPGNNEDWTTRCICSIKSIVELLALLYLLK